MKEVVATCAPWVAEFFSNTAPGWRRIDHPYVHFRNLRDDTILVVVSGQVEADGRRWIHVSVSCRNRLPTWETYAKVKDAFIGESRKAIQVLPPRSEYVNHHPYCLHLFTCLDGDPLPDFRVGGLV